MKKEEFLAIVDLLDVNNADPHVFLPENIFESAKSVLTETEEPLKNLRADFPESFKYTGDSPFFMFNCYSFILDKEATEILAKDKQGNQIHFGQQGGEGKLYLAFNDWSFPRILDLNEQEKYVRFYGRDGIFYNIDSINPDKKITDFNILIEKDTALKRMFGE